MTAAAENPFHGSPVPDEIVRTGENPTAGSLEEMRTMIDKRLGR